MNDEAEMVKQADDPEAATRAQAPRELSEEELNGQNGEELPDREAMSLINGNVAAPVNLAAALNVLSDNSTAVAEAQQSNVITQHN